MRVRVEKRVIGKVVERKQVPNLKRMVIGSKRRVDEGGMKINVGGVQMRVKLGVQIERGKLRLGIVLHYDRHRYGVGS